MIRGETYHFELVSNESGAGITRIGLDFGMPIANAVLTTENDEQAVARMTEKGRDAARVAVEMANLPSRWNNSAGETTKKTKTTDRTGMKSARRTLRANSPCRGFTSGCCRAAPGGEIDAHLRGAQGFDKADHEHLDAFCTARSAIRKRCPRAIAPCLDRPIDAALAGRARRAAGRPRSS